MRLPNLLYLADVPVESSYHGSALLHRLLSEWPPEKLLLVEPNYAQSKPARRLPNTAYQTLPFGIPRLLFSRMADVYGSFLLSTARSRSTALRNLLGEFKPEAVLTVAHGYSWLTAAAFAEKAGLPLHLILHDDWLLELRVLQGIKPLAKRWLCHYYRQAVSRFCVSPGMVETYQKAFGVNGTILYPSQAPDCPDFEQPAPHVSDVLACPTVAYAGTINGSGKCRALRDMAEALIPLRGRLLIFGPLTQDQAKKVGLNLPNIELCGLINSKELILRLREETDLLYVPMQFDNRDRHNIGVSFPSKLTDCTATGIPLLIRGPASCSAVRWALENPGVAEIVDSEDQRSLSQAVARLFGDGGLRWGLATNALQKGREYFSHDTARRVFLDSFQKGRESVTNEHN